MNVDEIRSFVILAEHLHFGRASQVLHLSQPALTKQIRRLEESFGGKLFERGKHGTSLTALGERCLPDARKALDSFDRLRTDARRAAQGKIGRLRIGFGSYTQELVPRVIVKLRQAEPGIEISLRDMSTSEQYSALQDGHLDIGFTRLPVPASVGDCETMPILKGHLALVTPSPPPHSKPVRLEEYRDQPFVLLSKERSPGLYALILSLCARHGFHPRVVQETYELTTALALVRSGMGFSVIPEAFPIHRFTGIEIQTIREKAAAWTVAAVWKRRDTNPALRRFLTILRSEVGPSV